jgi:surface antigen
MTTILIITETLRALAADLDGRIGELSSLATGGGSIAQQIEAQHVDALDVISAASRIRHLATRLAALPSPLRQVADWIERMEREGGIDVHLPNLPSLGMAQLNPGADSIAVNKAFSQAVGQGFFASAAAGVSKVRPSQDSPESIVGYRNLANTLGPYAPTGAYAYQCTAWANFRWRELGYTGPLLQGNGQDVARDAGPISADPSPGALASFSFPSGPFAGDGHVMVVESVTKGADGKAASFWASEANADGQATATTWGTRVQWVRDGAGWRQVQPPDATVRTIEFAPFKTS